jgi:AAA+ ATPase superfamily predicted ATPase
MAVKKFINRERELCALESQFAAPGASLMVIYGRRRLGKTTLIKEFIKDKRALYFLAREESEDISLKRFAQDLSLYTGEDVRMADSFDKWRDLFDVFLRYEQQEKKILVLDEFPYMVKSNRAFPSILQWVWDEMFQHANIMLILSGSLVHKMVKHALNYESPLYGRRTGQTKLKQIDFMFYDRFFDPMPYRNLVELYAVTGGVPRYIELFNPKNSIYDEISRLILSQDGLLFEEPEFLLRREVDEIGTYFSVIESIAAGNRKPGKLCSELGVKPNILSKCMKTLLDLDILECEVPVTERNPEKSKTCLYQIKDNFLRFWFRFVYPERSRIELGQCDYVLERIKANFIDNHVAHIYETVCRSELWRLAADGIVQFNTVGRYWNSTVEIDIVAFDNTGRDIVFAECKYRNQPMGTDVFFRLLEKKEHVAWEKEHRREKFALFSIGGFTNQLLELAATRDDLLLIGGDGKLQHAQSPHALALSGLKIC